MKKLESKHYRHVMYKASEEMAELSAELLKAANKKIDDQSMKKIKDEYSDVKKQLKLLDIIIQEYYK